LCLGLFSYILKIHFSRLNKMSLLLRVFLCSIFAFLISCAGESDGPLSTLQQSDGPNTAAAGSLMIRGPLQSISDNQLAVMGQKVAINDATRVIGKTYTNLTAGDVLSIYGTRQGGIIVSVEIRVETDVKSHIVVGTPEMNEQGQYVIGNLTLNFSSETTLDAGERHQYLIEGRFDDALNHLDIVKVTEHLTDTDQSTTAESGDTLSLDLEGDSACASTGQVLIYRLSSIDLNADLEIVTRDISTEAEIMPYTDGITVDSISDQGIGLRLLTQGITEVGFEHNGTEITRYFAALDAEFARPALLQLTNKDGCAFAYFPVNSSDCAIAVSGTGQTNSVFVSASSGGDGSYDRAGTAAQDGISVVNNNGTIQFGDEVFIDSCKVQSANGVPVISVQSQ
jgi:hypothetical protein